MKLTKYILGLAIVAAGLTSCDQDNVGAIYEPKADQASISFIASKVSSKTEDATIEVPVAVRRSITNSDYTTTVTLSEDASENMSLKSNQVTFKAGEGLAYVTVVVEDMEKGETYEGTLSLPDEVIKTANTDFGTQIIETTVSVMCDYNWLSAGTCTFTDYTWEDGYSAKNVPIQNAEGTNIYRIVSPLAAVYDASYVDGEGDDTNFNFYLNDDGSISIDDGAQMDYWGYLFYWDSRYVPDYCSIEHEPGSNFYGVNFLLLKETSLYLGGYFTFEWNQ
jgi:hypothetical protein